MGDMFDDIMRNADFNDFGKMFEEDDKVDYKSKVDMEQLLQKVIERDIVDTLKNYYFLTWNSIDELPMFIDLTNEEFEVIKELAIRSKLYNHVVDKNGTIYFFGKEEKQITNFIYEADLSDDDPCWNNWVYCKGSSWQLKEFKD